MKTQTKKKEIYIKVKGKYEHLKNPATLIPIFDQKYAKILIQHHAVVSYEVIITEKIMFDKLENDF